MTSRSVVINRKWGISNERNFSQFIIIRRQYAINFNEKHDDASLAFPATIQSELAELSAFFFPPFVRGQSNYPNPFSQSPHYSDIMRRQRTHRSQLHILTILLLCRPLSSSTFIWSLQCYLCPLKRNFSTRCPNKNVNLQDWMVCVGLLFFRFHK